MTIALTRPSPETINSSIAVILSVDQKTPMTTPDITPTKRINEQQAYAAVIHQNLSTLNPSLAKRFESELQQVSDKFKSNHGNTLDMFKISDRIMRQFVRQKDLSVTDYKALKYHAFGHAQLDSDRSRISSEKLPDAKDGDTALRAISTLYQKLEANSAASDQEFALFRSYEAEISKTKWRERRNNASTPTSSTEAASGFSINNAVTKNAETLPTGFLWKPQSESDGKLVVLLPSSLTTLVNSVRLKSPSGNSELEVGRYSGIGNGNRLHFRFNRSGESYPNGAHVEITLTDGSKLNIPISDTASRLGG